MYGNLRTNKKKIVDCKLQFVSYNFVTNNPINDRVNKIG